MATIEKFSLAVTSEQLALMKAAVATGEYATISEVVSEAVRDWQYKRELRQEYREILRRRFDAGKSSGNAGVQDMKALRAKTRGKLQRAEEAGRRG